jgi:2-polyprenyl-3-methyl-5-hydroxy-6-metoxy-1,4-benzoquinol methylase
MDLERLRRNWENLGRADPMWAVLTQAGTEGGKWDEAAFFQTGRDFVDWLGSWLALHQIPIPKGNALDFGCGLGRLTQALAPHFTTVTGVDISQPMIDGARAKNRHGDRVRYVCNVRSDLSAFDTGSFDYVQSVIVLQHMLPVYSLAYVREFMRVLRPGGLAFFQLATHAHGTAAATHAPAVATADEMYMELHCAPPEEVRAAIAAGGGEVLVAETDTWAGWHWLSEHFAVRRRAD